MKGPSSWKSARSDEWINTILIRPLASVLVRLFARIGLAPWQVVVLGTAAGTFGAAALAWDLWGRGMVLGGAGVLAKNLLDAADGQLARATGRVDRIGRFADSISDFWVNLIFGLAAGACLAPRLGWPAGLTLGAATGFLLILHCSLFVFYQVSYLASIRRSPVNRTDETPTPAESSARPLERRLQAVYLLLYGWQDRAFARLDRRMMPGPAAASGAQQARRENLWYGDALGLRLTSFLGLGTSLTLFGVLLLLHRPGGAVGWILLGQTGIALLALLYRVAVLGPRVRRLPAGPAEDQA